MHKKETICFQPDRPHSFGKGEGVWAGAWLVGWAAETWRVQSLLTSRALPPEAEEMATYVLPAQGPCWPTVSPQRTKDRT